MFAWQSTSRGNLNVNLDRERSLSRLFHRSYITRWTGSLSHFRCGWIDIDLFRINRRVFARVFAIVFFFLSLLDSWKNSFLIIPNEKSSISLSHRDYFLSAIIKLLSRATATANTCLPATPTWFPRRGTRTHARTHEPPPCKHSRTRLRASQLLNNLTCCRTRYYSDRRRDTPPPSNPVLSFGRARVLNLPLRIKSENKNRFSVRSVKKINLFLPFVQTVL